MIVVDTSVWVEHLRRGSKPLAALLDAAQVLVHPYVVGELALGELGSRTATLQELQRLPQAVVASHQELLHLIEQRRLSGLGIGYVDCHLLAAVLLTQNTKIWTFDTRLRAAADQWGLAYRPAG